MKKELGFLLVAIILINLIPLNIYAERVYNNDDEYICQSGTNKA